MPYINGEYFMNKCDLEETKHLALEKFKELTAGSYQYRYLHDWYLHEIEIGPFSLISYTRGAVIRLKIAGIVVATYSDASLGEDGPSREESPIASVWDAVMAREKAMENQQVCERIAKALDCYKLQEALKNTPLHEQMTSTAATQLEVKEHRWWQIW